MVLGHTIKADTISPFLKGAAMLTDTAIRKAKPTDTPYKLTDGQGLYLLVNAVGKYWRMNYRCAGKQKTLALGVYPDVPLIRAREKRDNARQMIADGLDPAEARQEKKRAAKIAQANNFEAVARAWYAIAYQGKADTTREKVIGRLENDVFPDIGALPVSSITAPQVKDLVQAVAQRGALDLARRVFNYVGRILRYAETERLVERDVSASIDLNLVLPAIKHKHHAALTDPMEVGALLRAIDGFSGSFLTVCALKLMALTFVRPGELRHTEWPEIDLDGATWSIPGSRMKMGNDHIVPLSTQAVAIFRQLQDLTGGGKYAFPSLHGSAVPMSENTMNAALRRMGFTNNKMTSHGFRAMARTLLHEQLHYPPEVIEHQLAHRVPDTLGTAYNRTKFLKERRAMMQSWADYLDKLKAGADVVKLRQA